MKTLRIFALLLAISVIFFSCGDDNPVDPPSGDLSISLLSPDEILPGDIMSISGKNLGKERLDAKVYFDNLMVQNYISWSDTIVKVVVPAITASGTVKIVKTNASSNTLNYFYYSGPKIFYAGFGRAYIDQEVDIHGQKFGTSKGNVYFNGIDAIKINLWNDSLIKVVVPSGATSGELKVKSGGKTSPGYYFTIATDSDPFIFTINPATTLIGTEIKVSGKNFGSTQGSNYVDFNGVKGASYSVWTKDSIRVKVPLGSTTGYLRVFVGTQSSNTIKINITGSEPDPIINSLSKNSFRPEEIITISGKNFRTTKPDNADVLFNGIKATEYTQWENTMIKVKVPVGTASGKLLVKIGDQVSNAMDYTIIAVSENPQITGINPASAQSGQIIYIAGKYFGATSGNDSYVMFGTNKATEIITWTVTEVAVKVPDIASGVYGVSVTAGGKKSNSHDFTVMQKAVNLVPLVEIPAGSYMMGSSSVQDQDAYPSHKITFTKPLMVGKYEVSQSAYRKVMSQANPSRIKDDNNPVEQVTWDDAVDFCNRLSAMEGLTPCYTISGGNVTCNWNAGGYRLLTEAEWEYACRAGSTGKFGNSNGSESSINSIGWNASNSTVIKNIGLLKANDFGIYDMHGNAAEWVWDFYDFYDEKELVDPAGPESGEERCFRGGGYIDGPNFCSNFKRQSAGPEQYQYYIGFRVCRRK
jgi:formylglycine-generating enzyme required for sulfatase activity